MDTYWWFAPSSTDAQSHCPGPLFHVHPRMCLEDVLRVQVSSARAWFASHRSFGSSPIRRVSRAGVRIGDIDRGQNNLVRWGRGLMEVTAAWCFVYRVARSLPPTFRQNLCTRETKQTRVIVLIDLVGGEVVGVMVECPRSWYVDAYNTAWNCLCFLVVQNKNCLSSGANVAMLNAQW